MISPKAELLASVATMGDVVMRESARCVSDKITVAMDHHRAGRLQDAAGIYQQVIATEPENFVALNNLGLIAKAGQKLDMAIDLFQRAIHSNPSSIDAHNNLGVAFKKLGRLADAVRCYRFALTIRPDDAELHNNLGNALKDQNKLGEAVACYRRALEIFPRYAFAHNNLANALGQMGDISGSLASTRCALEIDPHYREARRNLALFLLEHGDAESVLDECAMLLRQDPYDVEALAMKAVALSEAGRVDEEKYLVDFERLLQCHHLFAPGRFSCVEQLNSELSQCIDDHPTLRWSPPDKATRNGWHTGELMGSDEPALAAVEQMVRCAVEDRLSSLPDDPDHPFVANRPSEYALTGWALKMVAQGHEEPHVHPAGWISGVYYVTLPSSVDAQSADCAGWLEFGRAQDEFHRASAPASRRVKPIEGMIVTFPSYFWHQTIPFKEHENRVCIAFDVIRLN